jgi:2-dehydro-3-deoxygluconokinase
LKAEHPKNKAAFFMHADLLAFGEPMIEFNQIKGGDGRNFLQGFGGDTSNFIIAAARQGAKTGYISQLGADAHGAMLRDLWNQEGVDHALVPTHANAPTGVYFVTHSAAGHAFSFLRQGSAASLYLPSDLPLDAIRAAKALHLSGISLAISNSACDAAFCAMQTARASGCLVSFDTNLRLKLWSIERARAIMSEAIALSDICLPSYEDVVAISGLTEPEALIDWVLRKGAKRVVLKLGEKGAMVADGTKRIAIAPHPCRPVDATGAGDCFGGALIARLIAGDDLVDAARYAGVAAALSTQGYGAVAPIPHAQDVLAAMGSA